GLILSERLDFRVASRESVGPVVETLLRFLLARLLLRACTSPTNSFGPALRLFGAQQSLPQFCPDYSRADQRGSRCRCCHPRVLPRVRAVRLPCRSSSAATRAGPSWPNPRAQRARVA